MSADHSQTTVTVQGCDTLWSLAEKHLGDPLKWTVLWQLNACRILEEQRRRKISPLRPEDWIFPGTRLVLPGTATP